MKDRSEDPSHHERMLLPRISISLPNIDGISVSVHARVRLYVCVHTFVRSCVHILYTLYILCTNVSTASNSTALVYKFFHSTASHNYNIAIYRE